tara:strand:- start:308 stop:1681 length:1374 start_codon:yes stop_codon:yes gene_type:complete
MSSKALYEILEAEYNFLSGDAHYLNRGKGKKPKRISIFREYTSNVRGHYFFIDAATLASATMEQLRHIGVTVDEGLNLLVGRESKVFCADLFEEFKRRSITTKNQNFILTGTPTNFTATVTQAEKGGEANIFGTFQYVKQAAQKPYVDSINAYLERTGTQGDKKFSGGMLNITHQEGSSVSEQRAAATLRELQYFSRTNKEAGAHLAMLLAQRGSALTLEALNTGNFEDIVTARISIGSEIQNKAQGASKTEQGLIAGLEKDLEDFLSTFKDPGNLEGSDSPVVRVQKKVLGALKDSIKNKKKVQVNFQDTKIRLKKQKATRKSKPKVQVIPYKEKRVSGKKASSNRAAQQSSFMELAGLLNQKLPRTVRKNMGPPGLENVTGRFASSVRVTDVTATPKGFPSIGYTYEKNPYQVFEMSQGVAPWATPDRDPRNVIDRSIREIAAEMAIGRFFTRRV